MTHERIELAEVLMMIELKEILGLTNRPIIPCRDVLVARLAKLDVDGSIVRDWLAKHNDERTRKCRILEAQQDIDWKRECRRLDRLAAKTKGMTKKKATLRADQVAELERQFAITRYPNLKELADLEVNLGLETIQMERWFDDRREKYARIVKGKMEEINEDATGEKPSEEVSMEVDPQPSTSQGLVTRVGGGMLDHELGIKRRRIDDNL